jgi:hypothetical protein
MSGSCTGARLQGSIKQNTHQMLDVETGIGSALPFMSSSCTGARLQGSRDIDKRPLHNTYTQY